MKKLLLIVSLCLALVADDTLLISGFSKHGSKTDRYDEEFKSVHLGLGYRHDVENHSFTTIAMNDSYGNMMYTATYGYNYDLWELDKFRLRVGAEFGVTVKKLKWVNYDTLESSFIYGVLPIAFIPTVSMRYKAYSINVLYVPQLEFGGSMVDEVTYVNFGISF